MRISDWSSDVCSSDLRARHQPVPDDRGRAVGGRIGGAAMIAQIERVSRHMNTPDTSAQDNGRRPVVVAVATGKGGVGKTHVSVNVAVSPARGGKRVMLFSADLSLANAGSVLGLPPDAPGGRASSG